MEQEKYAVGIPSFEKIRNSICVYVDKTKYIYDLINSGSDTFFLSRPRRFGKSLFISTLEAFFTAQDKLFEGLAIHDLIEEWESYPVLRFDFTPIAAESAIKLENYLKLSLEEKAKKYKLSVDFSAGIGAAFEFLIKNLVEQEKKRVVILIDEYDKGITEMLDNQEQLEQNQRILRPFFSVIKSQSDNIHFCFITGIARFRHYTLFSDVNNLNDLSMDPHYASLCGITMDEMLHYFPQGIQKLADNLNLSNDEVVDRLKNKYDGNRFTLKDTLVFNPFDLLNCFYKGWIRNYWIKSGVSKVFVKYLSKQRNFDLTSLTKLWVDEDRMEGTFKEDDPIPLLFQSGYLTIKDYDSGLYRLDIPNGEVREALVKELLPQYLGIGRDIIAEDVVKLKNIIECGDIEALMNKLTAFLGSIPYQQFDYENKEKTYHLAIYCLFLMIGVEVRSEISISGGRIDMVVTTSNCVYVMEFKLDGTPEEALKQIDSKEYALPWKADKRKVIKVGVVFSSETRNISDWDSEPKCK